MRCNISLSLNLLFCSVNIASAFLPSFCHNGAPNMKTQTTQFLLASDHTADDENDNNNEDVRACNNNRRELFLMAGSSIAMVNTIIMNPQPSHALVKGVAPPSGGFGSSSKNQPKCTNVEECEAQREKKEQELREEMLATAVPTLKTPGGVQYKDLEEGSSTLSVRDNDDVTLFYKVLKLGKRSYDGISGEGTVVFSRGYGLEDDEKKPGDKSFITTVGGFNNIAALNEAIIGMKVGGVRRISVLPQKGWRKPIKACDGGPGGSGQGGDLKTDYVVVPTATMVEQEACFDMSRQPFPASYAQQRRMAQRFDQSLIMEVQVVDVSRPKSGNEQMEVQVVDASRPKSGDEQMEVQVVDASPLKSANEQLSE